MRKNKEYLWCVWNKTKNHIHFVFDGNEYHTLVFPTRRQARNCDYGGYYYGDKLVVRKCKVVIEG